MKALILNSGIGKRMGSFTDHQPKCLIEINNGETILSLQVKMLMDFNIKNFIITTGPFSEKIKEYMNTLFPSINVHYVHNPEYAITNYIYSMYRAKELLVEDDLLLLHGDIVTEKRVCEKLIDDSNNNAVIVNNQVPLPEKDFKARIKKNIIFDISIHTFGRDSVFLLPFYKLSKNTMLLWITEIEKSIHNNVRDIYAENVLTTIYEKIALSPVYLKDELCMEIDTPEDLELAKKLYIGMKGY